MPAAAADGVSVSRGGSWAGITITEPLPASDAARAVAEGFGATVIGEAGDETVAPQSLPGVDLRRALAALLPGRPFVIREDAGGLVVLFPGASASAVSPPALPQAGPGPRNAAGIAVPVQDLNGFVRGLPMFRRR